MGAYDYTTKIQIDAYRFIEGKLEVASGAWRRTTFPALPEGKVVRLWLEFYRITNGLAVALDIPEGAIVSLVGKRLRGEVPIGDVLFSVPVFTDGVGSLNLWNTVLRDAIGDFPSIPVRIELSINSEDFNGIWTFDTTIQRTVYHGTPPVVVGAPAYLNEKEVNAQFARRDGPTGYRTKLMLYEGALVWAQAVGTKWVAPIIIKVGGSYTDTYIEVGDVE